MTHNEIHIEQTFNLQNKESDSIELVSNQSNKNMKDTIDSKDMKDSKDTKDTKDSKDTIDSKDSKDMKDTKDTIDSKDIKGSNDSSDMNDMSDMKHMNDMIHDLETHQTNQEKQIEELKQTFDKVESKDNLYQELCERAPIGFITINENGIIQKANLSAAQLLGMERSELILRSFKEFIHQEDQNSYEQLKKKHLETLQPLKCDLRIMRDKENFMWVHIDAIEDHSNGDIHQCNLFLNNINDYKMTEKVLWESEEKYRLLYTSMEQGLALHEIITDENERPIDYVYLDINDSYTRLLGVTREMAIGKRIREVMPLVEQYWIDIFGEVALTGIPHYYENYLETTGRYYSTYTYSPKKHQFAVLVSDITERKLSEEAVLSSEAKHRSMIANISDVISIIDANGFITYKSVNCEKYFGWLSEDLIGEYYTVTSHPEDIELIHDAFISLMEKPNTEKTFEYRYKCKDKSYKMVHMTAVNLTNDPNIKGILVNYHDITDWKKAEEELIQAKNVAETANSTQRRFLANMSHEIRTPLNGLMGMLQLLDTTTLSEEQKEYVHLSSLSSKALLVVINDILDYSKLEADKMELETRSFSLHHVMEDVVKLFRLSISESKVMIETSIADNIPEALLGDPFRLKQVLSNLIGNAVKFTKEGWIRISVRILKTTEDNQLTLFFMVEDTGIGIPEDRIADLFHMFSQVDNSISRKYGGSGLGLAISKGLVEMMGGKIWLQRKKEMGSCFHFTVEMGVDLNHSLKKTETSVNYEKNNHHVERQVLLAEDDPISARIMKYFAKSKGWNIEVAGSGLEVLDLISKKNFDIILMDIQMPDMDGFTATKLIREMEEQTKCYIPIIAITAYAMKEDHKKCLNAGMNDYISKPVDLDLLYTAVERLCSSRVGAIEKDTSRLFDNKEF